MAKLNVLLTGSCGRIGKVFTPAFRERYNLRTLDLQPTPGHDDMLVGDLQDRNLLDIAMEGIDVVVHLAATSDEAPFLEQLVPNNIVGVYNVFEAAHQAGVRRIVFASTCQTVLAGCWNRQHTLDHILDTEERPHPSTIYGVTKVFGETLGQYYHDYRGMEFVAIRIGAFLSPDNMNGEMHRYGRNIWLSHNDAIRLFNLAIEKPGVDHALVYGTSITEQELMSRTPASQFLGFEPEDGAAEQEFGRRPLLLAA
jgi:uronate dehydrogenase